MATSAQKSRDLFDALCLKRLGEEVELETKQELDDIAEDIEDEIHLDAEMDEDYVFLSKEAPQRSGGSDITIEVPSDTIVTKDSEGNVLSRFSDNCWTFEGKDQSFHDLVFGNTSESWQINFDDPHASSYLHLQKLLTYTTLPQVDVYKKPLAAATFRHHLGQNHALLGYLYSEGFLLGDNNDGLLTLPELCPQTFQRKLYELMEADTPVGSVRAHASALSRLCALGSRPFCPPELKVSFHFNDVFDKKLTRKVSRYEASKSGRWKAVDFDVLESLVPRAKNYIENFYKDVLWLLEKYRDACIANKEAGQAGRLHQIDNRSHRKPFFDAIVNRKFAIDPATGKPWSTVTVLEGRIEREPRLGPYVYQYVGLEEIHKMIQKLAGACIFVICLFTGVRRRELINLKTTALAINGEALDLFHDAVKQVADAGPDAKFDLQRKIYKIDKNQIRGRAHEVPIPAKAAHAFAILVELFRQGRKMIGIDYLVPPRFSNILPHADEVKLAGVKVKFNSCRPNALLAYFYADVGVDFQSTHKIRKSLATLLINDDHSSLVVIKFLLGHETPEMTRRYLMDLPVIKEELLAYRKEKKLQMLKQIIGDATEGKAGGHGGERSMDAVLKNREAFSGRNLATTMDTLINSLVRGGFNITKTPAAWCLRTDSRVPRDAPCFSKVIRDAIANGEIVDGLQLHVQPEHCIPWKCGDAYHSTRDKEAVRRELRYATQKLNGAGNSENRAKYQERVEYWTWVADILEHGREDIASLHLLDSFAKEVGNGL